ncbi:hypothetical protein [Blastococcus saxobsidens]|uniref:Lipoprotein n=1 Tax=Blastococcus saxobsidens (strain DD2) TaxID=1146883 RepID=H6RRX2_BLASD|nr:hypothetical protein [Blastococcus saxobsidens]CCG02966.1 conserved exported protein of unknown function [Blastococcus saxobsidens DD2]
MRLLLAAASSLLVLAGCGTTDAAVPSASAPPSAGTETIDAVAAAETARCDHPAGFSVGYPADWSVNSGEVLPLCSWFDGESFSVPEATDVRIAAVTLSVQPADGFVAAWPDETARTAVDVGGRAAMRVEQVAGPGFYPAGTPITTYVVELGSELPGGSVLVADTVGLPGFDHDRNVEVLDAMMASLVFDRAARV